MAKELVAVLLGDLHIGKRWQAHTTPQTRAQLSEKYYYPVTEAACKYPLTPLISAGDWFDRSHNDELTVLKSAGMISNFELVVAGNHDVMNRVDDISSLSLLAQLDKDSPIVIGRTHLTTLEVKDREQSKEIAVVCVPHQLTQADFEKELEHAAHLAQAAVKSNAYGAILVTHCNYHSSEGKPDSDLYLTPALQAMLEPHFDFIFLGHEHLVKQKGKVVVLGSCQPCNFGEIGPRFFHELWFENNQLSVERVPIESAMQHREVAIHKTVPIDLEYILANVPELVTISGVVELTEASRVQELVKEVYRAGAMAVRVSVEFDTGTNISGDQVKGSLSNLVEIVRDEIKDNKPWAELFETVLSTVPQEQN